VTDYASLRWSLAALAIIAAAGWTFGFYQMSRPAAVLVERHIEFVEVQVPFEDVETPIADSLIDFDELERESECLWEYLQEAGVEITFRNVVAAGDWTAALGGACLLIGETDE